MVMAIKTVLNVKVTQKHRDVAEELKQPIVDTAIEDALYEQFPLKEGFVWFASFFSELGPENNTPECYDIAVFKEGASEDDHEFLDGIRCRIPLFLGQEWHLQKCPNNPHNFSFDFPTERFLQWLKDE